MNIKLEQKATAFHIIVGIIIGIFSGLMSKDPYQIANTGVLLFTLGFLSIAYFATMRLFKPRSLETAEQKYGAKWYLSNGVYPYMIFWLLAWIVIYNI